MSATKIAATFRVSLTAPTPRSPGRGGLSIAALPCCAGDDVEAESAFLRVDRPVYPRRAERSTVGDGAIDDVCRAATTRNLRHAADNRQIAFSRLSDR
jgi:hypothetical protein